MIFINILIAILAFFLLVGIIVIIHEGGHYLTAILCRIKILEFSIGFGPKLYQTFIGKDKTLFTLRAIPMGGYVKPLDENTCPTEEWNQFSEEDKKRAFSHVPKWKKFLMVAGGPLSNFILAFVLLTGVYMYYGNDGVKPVIKEIAPNSLFSQTPLQKGDEIVAIDGTTVKMNHTAMALLLQTVMSNQNFDITVKNNNGTHTYNIPTKNLNYDGLLNSQEDFHGLTLQNTIGDVLVYQVNAESPASHVGIQPGDIIVSVNGEKANDVNALVKQFHQSPGKEFMITYQRYNKEYTVKVIPELKELDNQKVGLIGIRTKIINPQNIRHFTYSLSEASHEAITNTMRQLSTNINVITKLITGELSTRSISGPLSIAEYSGYSFQLGTKYFLQMMAAISIAIGFFNLLPIPMLDGGHLTQYIIETIRRKDFTMNQLMFVQKIGIVCLISIFTLALGNDLIRYVTTYF